MNGHATIGAEDGVLAIAAHRRVGIANVAAGAIARPSIAVVPAARVLRNIAAERALVANLRRCNNFNGLRKHTVLAT